MAIITFWTEIEKEIGQTQSAIAVATQMALDHNNKILLLTTNNFSEIKDAFWKREQEIKKKGLFGSLRDTNKQFVGLDNGMESIAMAIASNRLTPEQITNYTKAVLKNRLEILPASEKSEEQYKREIFVHYPELLKKADMYYDYIFVDLNKEVNDVTKEILNNSTIIAYGINQKESNLTKIAKSIHEGFCSNKQNIMPYIARSDSNSKYSLKNISRTLKIKRVGSIPYNILFTESCDEGMAAEYFLKMSTMSGTDSNINFINEVRAFVDNILYKEQELKMNYGKN